jgi:hypothetical protein
MMMTVVIGVVVRRVAVTGALVGVVVVMQGRHRAVDRLKILRRQRINASTLAMDVLVQAHDVLRVLGHHAQVVRYRTIVHFRSA